MTKANQPTSTIGSESCNARAMKTTLGRDTRGAWQSETSMDIDASKVLVILTMKRSGGTLVSTASVHQKDGGFLSHTFNRDYRVNLADRKVRVSESTVAAQHAEALGMLDVVLASVQKHYHVEEVAA